MAFVIFMLDIRNIFVSIFVIIPWDFQWVNLVSLLGENQREKLVLPDPIPNKPIREQTILNIAYYLLQKHYILSGFQTFTNLYQVLNMVPKSIGPKN